MNCPYCSHPMEVGTIRDYGDVLCWRPYGSRDNFRFRGTLPKGGVLLGKFSWLKGSAATSWLCRTCGKVILDVYKTPWSWPKPIDE